MQIENALRQRDEYKSFAELLALHRMSKDAAVSFLRDSIFTSKEIDAKDAKGKTVKVMSEPSTRESNRMDALEKAYETTLEEVANENTAWTVWNAITRFADHESGIRMTEDRKAEGVSETQVRFENNLYGNSAAFKASRMADIKTLIAA